MKGNEEAHGINVKIRRLGSTERQRSVAPAVLPEFLFVNRRAAEEDDSGLNG